MDQIPLTPPAAAKPPNAVVSFFVSNEALEAPM